MFRRFSSSDTDIDAFRSFMIKLANRVTGVDVLGNMKYFLCNIIPEAKMEAIKTALDLFKELQKLDVIGPQKLEGLRHLLEMIHEPGLVSMVDDFASSCRSSLPLSTSAINWKSEDENYLAMANYLLLIKGGKHFERDSREFVELRSGQIYALCIANKNNFRSRCEIKIDGHVVFVSFVLMPQQACIIERPSQSGSSFKFFAVEHAPPGSGIWPENDLNGLVEVKFIAERADMRITCCFQDRKRTLSCSTETSDVEFRDMVVSAFKLQKTSFFILFNWKPIGQRDIKLIEYGIDDGSSIRIIPRMVGGGIYHPTTQQIENNKAPRWVPGATTLQGESKQTFGSCPGFILDEEKCVTLRLRLLANADESPLSSNELCSPLVKETPIPPPVFKW